MKTNQEMCICGHEKKEHVETKLGGRYYCVFEGCECRSFSPAPQGEKEEFPEGKENYCPRCYFEDEKVILRKDCPHNTSSISKVEKGEENIKIAVEQLEKLPDEVLFPFNSPSPQEPSGWEKVFEELDHNPDWKDLCERYAPGGIFYELHDDILQSELARIISAEIEKKDKECEQKVKEAYERGMYDYAESRKDGLMPEKWKEGFREGVIANFVARAKEKLAGNIKKLYCTEEELGYHDKSCDGVCEKATLKKVSALLDELMNQEK